MATKFADISKPSKDLLFDDYVSGYVLKCKRTAGPVAVTMETVQNKDGALSSKVGTKFSYAKFNLDKGQVNADGSRVLETSLTLSPELSLSFKANQGADLALDYKKNLFCATGVLDVLDMSQCTTSVCVGVSRTSGVKIGGDATYGLAGQGLTGFSLGGSYTQGPLFASVTAVNKCSTCNVGLMYTIKSEKWNDILTLASHISHSREKFVSAYTVGLAYQQAKVGLVKAKMSTNGLISASLVRSIAPAVTLTATGTITQMDVSTFKPGISITM